MRTNPAPPYETVEPFPTPAIAQSRAAKRRRDAAERARIWRRQQRSEMVLLTAIADGLRAAFREELAGRRRGDAPETYTLRVETVMRTARKALVEAEDLSHDEAVVLLRDRLTAVRSHEI